MSRRAGLLLLLVFPLSCQDAGDPETKTVPGRGSAARQSTLRCMNNLRQIGGLLAAMEAAGELRYRDGPAFLLQAARMVRDEDLVVFLCPGEDPAAAPQRPPVGSPEFVRMFRELDLMRDQDWSRLTSYAGPNWRDHPRRQGGPGPRLWACDRCAGGNPHHGAGIVVLWESGKVEVQKLPDLEGHDPALGRILVGPASPDPRLGKMVFER